MEQARVFDEMLAVVDSCTARIGWRLRPRSKHQLSNDILALCTGLRSVTLVDYDGIMPELQDNLSKLLYHARLESVILKPLRVMVISEMAYLIHVGGLAELALSSLQSPHQLHLLDTETDPPRLLPSSVEGNQLITELVQVQKKFSEVFPVGVDTDLLLPMASCGETTKSESSETNAFASLCIDLTSLMQNVDISIPTLNGWLLGYPVTYLFSNDKLKNATGLISMQSLHIYKIYVTRNKARGGNCEHELMSFSVPSGISVRGDREPWAEEFLARIRQKLEMASTVWHSIRMEIEAIMEPRSVVF